MTVVITKKEDVLIYRNSEDLIPLLRSVITSWDSSEINSPTTEEVLQLLESLKIVILAKQARAENSTTI